VQAKITNTHLENTCQFCTANPDLFLYRRKSRQDTACIGTGSQVSKCPARKEFGYQCLCAGIYTQANTVYTKLRCPLTRSHWRIRLAADLHAHMQFQQDSSHRHLRCAYSRILLGKALALSCLVLNTSSLLDTSCRTSRWCGMSMILLGTVLGPSVCGGMPSQRDNQCMTFAQ